MIINLVLLGVLGDLLEKASLRLVVNTFPKASCIVFKVVLGTEKVKYFVGLEVEIQIV